MDTEYICPCFSTLLAWPVILISLKLSRFRTESPTSSFHPGQTGTVGHSTYCPDLAYEGFLDKSSPAVWLMRCLISKHQPLRLENTHPPQFLPQRAHANTFVYFTWISTSHFSHCHRHPISLVKWFQKHLVLPKQTWRRKESGSCVSELRRDERVHHPS